MSEEAMATEPAVERHFGFLGIMRQRTQRNRRTGRRAALQAVGLATPIRFMITHCWVIERMLFQVQ